MLYKILRLMPNLMFACPSKRRDVGRRSYKSGGKVRDTFPFRASIGRVRQPMTRSSLQSFRRAFRVIVSPFGTRTSVKRTLTFDTRFRRHAACRDDHDISDRKIASPRLTAMQCSCYRSSSWLVRSPRNGDQLTAAHQSA